MIGLSLALAGCGPGDRMVSGTWLNLSGERVQVVDRAGSALALPSGAAVPTRYVYVGNLSTKEMEIRYERTGRTVKAYIADFVVNDPVREMNCLMIVPSYADWTRGVRPGAHGPFAGRRKGTS